MNIDELRQFLIDLNLAGYASADVKKWIKNKDHSTTIPFTKGKFHSNDNFFGGEPYGGRVIVFYKEKPVWMMVYFGAVNKGEKPDPVYVILREALKRMPKDYPFRGPKGYRSGDFRYINIWKGDLEKYEGEEKIYKGKKEIYSAKYIGGLVDKREGV